MENYLPADRRLDPYNSSAAGHLPFTVPIIPQIGVKGKSGFTSHGVSTALEVGAEALGQNLLLLGGHFLAEAACTPFIEMQALLFAGRLFRAVFIDDLLNGGRGFVEAQEADQPSSFRIIVPKQVLIAGVQG